MEMSEDFIVSTCRTNNRGSVCKTHIDQCWSYHALEIWNYSSIYNFHDHIKSMLGPPLYHRYITSPGLRQEVVQAMSRVIAPGSWNVRVPHLDTRKLGTRGGAGKWWRHLRLSMASK
jgi:hypothetical protein